MVANLKKTFVTHHPGFSRQPVSVFSSMTSRKIRKHFSCFMMGVDTSIPDYDDPEKSDCHPSPLGASETTSFLYLIQPIKIKSCCGAGFRISRSAGFLLQ
ncbi:MAG: hypothetical protein ABFC71_09150 [Methanoregula sp.]|jgi:hypothetical protein